MLVKLKQFLNWRKVTFSVKICFSKDNVILNDHWLTHLDKLKSRNVCLIRSLNSHRATEVIMAPIPKRWFETPYMKGLRTLNPSNPKIYDQWKKIWFHYGLWNTCSKYRKQLVILFLTNFVKVRNKTRMSRNLFCNVSS